MNEIIVTVLFISIFTIGFILGDKYKKSKAKEDAWNRLYDL